MTRRTFFGALGSASPVRAAAGRRPNVLLVMTDDQGYGDLACHGNPVIKTPAIDQLHRRSLRFTNFHASPTCSPTRSALMTGRYSNATGVWHTILGRSLLRPGEITMADCFRASGYRTGIFGKWHLGDNYPCRPQDRGFEEALIHGGGAIGNAPDYFGNDYFDDTYFRNGKPEKFTGHCTDVWFENARHFMAASAAARRPFFCYLATNAPHDPMWSPERYAAMYQNVRGLKDAGFYGMITHIDDNLARLTKFLDSHGLTENTILIFMTDNGTAAGAGVFNASMRGVKGSPYDGGHRVPFFLSWPGGGLGGGRDVGRLAAHIDVLPTLMDICGLRRPDGPPMHGRSLRPLIVAENPSWAERALVVDSQRVEDLVRWRQAAVMADSWRLVNPSADGDQAKLELYDIRTDPSQREDVARSNPKIVDRLRAEYDAWWKLVTPGSEEQVRIVIGNPAENPSRLTSHDWHTRGPDPAFSQSRVRRAFVSNGTWALRVERAGVYRFELCRWPKEAGLPINALYQDKEPNRDKTPGQAIHAVSARIRIGREQRTTAVAAGDAAAVFEVKLPSGPADLQTWFTDTDGTERGAYYVYVTRL